jgi:hypothetical protein
MAIVSLFIIYHHRLLLFSFSPADLRQLNRHRVEADTRLKDGHEEDPDRRKKQNKRE